MSTLRDALASLFPEVAAAQRTCRKIPHEHREGALSQLRSMLRSAETCVEPETLGVYKCGTCGAWHTGHKKEEMT